MHRLRTLVVQTIELLGVIVITMPVLIAFLLVALTLVVFHSRRKM